MYQADHTQYYDYGLDTRSGIVNRYHNDTLNTYLGLGNDYTTPPLTLPNAAIDAAGALRPHRPDLGALQYRE